MAASRVHRVFGGITSGLRLATAIEAASRPVRGRSRSNAEAGLLPFLRSAASSFLVLLVALAMPAAAQESGAEPNLTWQKFPAEFADYYTTQRVGAIPAEPQPFTKSAKPVKISHPTLFTANAILDESGGTGTGYDTLYIDSGSGDFSNPTVYKISPQDRKTGLEGHALVSYFDDVTVQRGADSVHGPGSVKVQLFIELNPDQVDGNEYLVNMIPAQWAVGTIEVNGQPTPVAVVDGTFDGELTRRGMRPHYINSLSPGDDAGVVRSDYLILGRPGETSLQPGDPNGWLGKTGSARSMFTQYLTTDSGTFEIQLNPQAEGVDLQLAPANVPMATIDLSQVPRDQRLVMFGTNACVLLENPGDILQVPADSYYLPSLGSQLVEAMEGETLQLTPAGVEGVGLSEEEVAADRGQRLFTTMEPPGGALGATQWSEPTDRPFAFAQPRAGWKKLELTVLGENNRPIAGATVDIRCSAGRGGPGSSGSKSYKTDSAGKCIAMLPSGEENYVNVMVSAPDYVGSEIYWGDQYSAAVPEQYTWTLEKGSPIGGRVVDEHGRPIRDAQVQLDASGRSFTPGKAIPVLSRQPLTTDARGKWVCKTAPAKLTSVAVRLSHPDYVSDYAEGRAAKIEELRNQTAEFVMKPGVVVTGRVTDSHGKPIERAEVMYGDGRSYIGAHTDKQGRYKTRGVKPGEMTIQVQAKGYASTLKKVTVEEHMRPVDIELKQGNVLKGRVVDEGGNPVPNAQVWLQRSEGLGWSGTTDAQGRFTWKEAPEGEITLAVHADGYEWQGEWKVRAGQDNVFTLKGKPLLVTGRVVDAATGAPIAKFRVVPGMFYGPMATPQWMSWRAVSGKDGAFQIRLSAQEQVSRYQIRIEAAGYKPGKSSEFTAEQADQPLEISLQVGQGASGVVIGVDGQPVVGAQVGIGTSSAAAMVYDGHLQRHGPGGLATSGEGGKFTLEPEDDEYSVIAVHDSGIGQVSRKEFESSGQVKLQAWGRIEGKADVRKRKASEQQINVGSQGAGPDQPQMHFWANPRIEEDGTFVVEKAMPGALAINVMSRMEEGGMPSMYTMKRVKVAAGETVKVSLESNGKTVSGRVASSGKQFDWKRSMVMLFPARKAPKVPASVAGKDRKAIQEWYAKWADSEEGQTARASDEPSRAQPKEDGAFVFEYVAPGNYVLQAIAADPSGDQRSWQLAGFAIQSVKVPSDSGDVPVEVGTVTLKPMEGLEKGQPAPAVDLKGFDGKTVRLSDFRGKYVWLTFWSGEMSYGPSFQGMMSNMLKAYTKDDRIAMISVELEGSLEDARNFSLIYDMPGRQTYGGEVGRSPAAKAYGVSFMPTFVLIDPEGKIEANGPDPSEALRVLRNALGTPRDSKAASSQAAGTQASNDP